MLPDDTVSFIWCIIGKMQQLSTLQLQFYYTLNYRKFVIKHSFAWKQVVQKLPRWAKNTSYIILDMKTHLLFIAQTHFCIQLTFANHLTPMDIYTLNGAKDFPHQFYFQDDTIKNKINETYEIYKPRKLNLFLI